MNFVIFFDIYNVIWEIFFMACDLCKPILFVFDIVKT